MKFEIPIARGIPDMEAFQSFTIEIDYLAQFFVDFSDLIYSNAHQISFITDEKIFELDTRLIDSSAQTLRSIKLCGSLGSFCDANTLVRKMRDDLVQYLYILSIVSLRKPFSEETANQIQFHSPESFASSISTLEFNKIMSDDEKAVTAWFDNTVTQMPTRIKKKLEFQNYMKVLRENQNIDCILTTFNLEKYWKVLSKALNNYVHNNGTKFSKQNCVTFGDQGLHLHLSNISKRTQYISSFFVSVLLMIDSSLVSSTDYIDYLDCGMEPPENCQYFIAPFIQEFIDKTLSKLHPELKQFLSANNIHGMNIE